MLRYSYRSISFAIIAVLISASPTSLPARQYNPLLLQLQKTLADTTQRNIAESAGQDRALICSYCHGNDGNSIKPGVPNLAGQNPDYLLQQIGHFASGERKDFVMNSLATKFTDEDQINLAIYYSAQNVKPTGADPAMAKRGKRIYLANCQRCHGLKGMGKPGYARLAGQKQTYIEKTLRRFHAGVNDPSARRQRHSPIMEPIAGKLSEQEIRYLAAYIASM